MAKEQKKRDWRLSVLIPEEVAEHGDNVEDWSGHTQAIFQFVKRACCGTLSKPHGRPGGFGSCSNEWDALMGMGWDSLCRYLAEMGR